MGIFDKLKQGLAKTGRLLKTDVRDLFKGEGEQGRLIDQPFLDEMRASSSKPIWATTRVETNRRRGRQKLPRPHRHDEPGGRNLEEEAAAS